MKNENTVNIHGIEPDSMVNGDGLRVVLWLSGCNHHCKGCHNPQTWDENSGYEFTDELKESLFEELDKPWCDGLTLSGGDPLYPKNREVVTKIAKEVRERFPSKTIWCYTGYEFEEIQDLEILNYCDVFAVGPFIEEEKSLDMHYVGSKNQRLMEKQPDGSFVNKSEISAAIPQNIIKCSGCGE